RISLLPQIGHAAEEIGPGKIGLERRAGVVAADRLGMLRQRGMTMPQPEMRGEVPRIAAARVLQLRQRGAVVSPSAAWLKCWYSQARAKAQWRLVVRTAMPRAAAVCSIVRPA